MLKRIRNFIMISAIAILGLVILPSKTYALPYVDLNYSSIKTRFETYFYDMGDIIKYLDDNYGNNYDYVVRSRIKDTKGLTYIHISKKGTPRTYFSTHSISSDALSMYLSKTGNTYEDNRYVSCAIYANDFTTSKKSIDTCISQVATTTLNTPNYDFYNYFTSVGSNYKINYTGTDYANLLVYSNNKIYNKHVYNGSVQSQKYDFYLDGNTYSLNSEIPTYWEWLSTLNMPEYEKQLVSEPGKTVLNLNFDSYNTSVYTVTLCDNNLGMCYSINSLDYSKEFLENTNLTLNIYNITTKKYVFNENIVIEVEPKKEYQLRETYDGSVYSLESFDFDFDLQDLYDNSVGNDLKIKLEISNYESVKEIIESAFYEIFYRNKNTGFYEKTDFNYFPLNCEYVEEEHSLYLIFSNNLNKELYLYDGVRFSVNFQNSDKNNLNIYTNIEYGSFELFSSNIEYFPGYQKILISSQYKDYVISASESKSFNIIAKRENILNLTEGDLIVFKYDFSTPIYSSDTFEILNEGITLSPYPWASYNGTYNDYVEFYVTLDYINNKIVLIRNNHNEDFYIWVPYDVNISPVKNDGSFDLVIPDNGKVDGNASSNNKDYTNLPSIGDENFFSYMKKGISSFTGNISYIFQSVSNIFNGFSEGLQTFFITIFFLSLALFIIRFLF